MKDESARYEDDLRTSSSGIMPAPPRLLCACIVGLPEDVMGVRSLAGVASSCSIEWQAYKCVRGVQNVSAYTLAWQASQDGERRHIYTQLA